MKIKNLFFGVLATAAIATGCQEKTLDGSNLMVDKDTIDATKDKAEYVLNVTADCEWKATAKADWFTVEPATGKGNGQVTVFVNENAGAARSATLHFQKTSTMKVSFDVTVAQAAGRVLELGEGTLAKPYLASQAADVASQLADGATTPNKVYVKGYVKKFASKHAAGISDFGNALFYITDGPDFEGTDFYCYQVYYLGGKKFTSEDQIKIGDEVIVYGQLTNYNGTYETVGKGAAYCYSINGQTAGAETPDPTPGPIENDGTLAKPYKASEATAVALGLANGATTDTDVYVRGFVKKFASKHSDGIASFGNALFYITDDATGEGTDFYCYQVYYLGGQKFTSEDQIKLGDEVIVYGKLTNYNGTAETVGKGAAYIYSINGQTDGGETPGPGPDPTPAPDQPATLTEVTVAQFIAKPVNETDWYKITGVITNIAKADYGNFYIKDAAGDELYVYGMTSKWVGSNDKSFASLGLKVGDEVTFGTLRSEYQGTPQAGGNKIPAFYISHKEGEAPAEPENAIVLKFPDDNKDSNGVNGYDDPWTAKTGEYSFKMIEFNNYKWQNWTYVRCGRKTASTASIEGTIDVAVSKVVLNLTKVTASDVTSLKLYVGGTAIDAPAVKTGDIEFVIPAPAANQTYKLEFVCKASSESKNGFVEVTKLTFFK